MHQFSSRRKSTCKQSQHGIWGTSCEPPEPATIPHDGKQWKRVLKLLLIHYNHRHSSKQKSVSFKTQHERERFVFWLFDFLRNNPVKYYKPDPRSFTGMQVDFVAKHWKEQAEAGQLLPATLQTYFSFLKTFTTWIGKPGLLKPIHCYFDDPKLYQHRYVAKEDKTWKHAGVDIEQVIDSITQEDRYAGAAVRMLAVFGLRFKEGCCLRPHVDGVAAQCTNLKVSTATEYLDTHRGTKGGRQRFVPIETNAQRETLAFSRFVARYAMRTRA